jgi:hypothetical protein
MIVPHSRAISATVAALLLTLPTSGQSVAVTKTNPTKIYMHYMPWFQTPNILGGTSGSQWGYHWKMQTQNPNIVDATGKRQIASHYYPMIGPYDSTDPNVLEYHMLLMKYSGIDGVMIDWYGQQGSNGDVGSLLTASNAIANQTGQFGLGVGVVLEDRFAQNVAQEQTNMNYLRDNYFNKSNYIKYGPNNSPLMYNFGPITFQTPSQWSQILPATGTDPEFLTLPYQSNEAGANADGEFAWPYQDANTSDHLSVLRSFYTTQASSLKNSGKIAAGVAYPGFNDFYAQGGAGSTLFYIPENGGQTLTDTLNLYNTYKSNLSMLQLATFNDFGEGTQFEPTVEDGFRSLNQIQQFTGVSYGTAELQFIYELYLARKKYAGKTAIESQLDQVSNDLDGLNVSAAEALFATVAPAGDYDGNGLVDANDYAVWRYNFGKQTIIHGSGADGNYDGVIDQADYVVWRSSLASGAGAGARAGTAVPEPTIAALITLAAISAYSGTMRRRPLCPVKA